MKEVDRSCIRMAQIDATYGSQKFKTTMCLGSGEPVNCGDFKAFCEYPVFFRSTPYGELTREDWLQRTGRNGS